MGDPEEDERGTPGNSKPSGAGGRGQQQQQQKPHVLVIGSSAVHAAQEARRRVVVLEKALAEADGERLQLREQLQEIDVMMATAEKAAHAAVDAREGGGGRGGGGKGEGFKEDGSGGGGGAGAGMGAERAERLQRNVQVLSREVAVLTRERDSLLEMVLRQHQQVGGCNGARCACCDVLCSFVCCPVCLCPRWCCISISWWVGGCHTEKRA